MFKVGENLILVTEHFVYLKTFEMLSGCIVT